MIEVNILKTQVCPFCPKATAVVRKVASGMSDVEVKETYLDLDPQGQDIATRHNVMSVPTILINGQVAFVGVPPEDKLRRAIEEAQ